MLERHKFYKHDITIYMTWNYCILGAVDVRET